MEPASGEDALSEGVTAGLAKRYPGARIELGTIMRWTRGRLPAGVKAVAVLEDNSRGEIRIQVTGNESDDPDAPRVSEGWIAYAAWQPSFVAAHRILPGERLSVASFIAQDVNVSIGPFHDLRGLLVPPDAGLASLETRQTILEGTPLLSSAVQRVPDLRRGDAVRIRLVSNGLTLSVPGVAEEPAYLKGHVKVLTDKTKRELVGELEASGIVRVQL